MKKGTIGIQAVVAGFALLTLSAVSAGATTFYGVNQTTPLGTFATATGSGGSKAFTLSSGAGGSGRKAMATGRPPLSATRYNEVSPCANQMVPSPPQTPPVALVDGSASAVTEPPSAGTFCSFPPMKNPIQRPSGEKNG